MKVAWLVACCSSLARLPASPILIPTYVTQHENENGGLFAVESWLYNTIAVNKSTTIIGPTLLLYETACIAR